MTAVLLLGVFSICVAIGAPIGSAMGLASIITLLTTGMGFSMVPYNYYASLSKFLLRLFHSLFWLVILWKRRAFQLS